MSLSELDIGFIGGGAMGEALITGVIAAGARPERIRVAEPAPERRKALEEAHGIACSPNAPDVVPNADLVVLAVKPAIVGEVLAATASLDDATRVRPLWVSIAAGITLATLEGGLPPGARAVRAMPNTPALVGAGATAFAPGTSATAADADTARALFEAVGTSWQAPDEALLDAVTGLSGSGPAYVFVLLEALMDAGVSVGLPRDAASALATQTVLGAAQLAQQSGRHPRDLREQVTSPGGTTLAGLERLEACGFRRALHEAVEAATRRSRELGGG